MEIWVLLIISIRNKLEEVVARAEKRIMKVALNPSIDAFKQCEIVSELINKKNMLVNLKVLNDRICEALSEEKLEFIKEFLSIREDVDEYCLKNTTSPSALINTALTYAEEGALPLRQLGFTVGKMQEDYGSFPLVAMNMAVIKRLINKVRIKSPGVLLAFGKSAEVNFFAI